MAMKIKILQGMVHSSGDFVRGSEHDVAEKGEAGHPDHKLGNWLVSSGRAEVVDDSIEKTEKKVPKKADK